MYIVEDQTAGGLPMLNIPSALQSQFETCLQNTTMPKHVQAAYTKWLRYYLDFCQKYHFPHAQRESSALSPQITGKEANEGATTAGVTGNRAVLRACALQSFPHRAPFAQKG
jgi:hypothetical protein